MISLRQLLREALNIISKQTAVDKNMFGPVYHGTSAENHDAISKDGFKLFVGNTGDDNISNGYGIEPYYDGIPAPVHHLGYGIYFTTVKTIATKFNRGTTKGIVEYYLDAPRVETINFGAPRTMMKWWIDNGYDPKLAKTDRIAATKKLTANLSRQYDAVWFKGKGLYKLLDGDQICIFDPSKIYRIDPTLSTGLDIGAKVILTKDHYRRTSNYNTDTGEVTHGQVLDIPKNTRGVIISKTKVEDRMRSWAGNSEYAFGVKFTKGGTVHNILDSEIEPLVKV